MTALWKQALPPFICFIVAVLIVIGLAILVHYWWTKFNLIGDILKPTGINLDELWGNDSPFSDDFWENYLRSSSNLIDSIFYCLLPTTFYCLLPTSFYCLLPV